MPENIQDIVLLKTDGIPTYHFAHAVDDHLMRTTHVVRGDEWISSLPVHIQLFKLLGYKAPNSNMRLYDVDQSLAGGYSLHSRR